MSHQRQRRDQTLIELIVGVFNPAENCTYLRAIYDFIPGKPVKQWTNPNIAAKCGHLSLLEMLRAKGIACTHHGADNAAANGHLAVLQYLDWKFTEPGISPTQKGFDLAIRHGHVNVVEWFGSSFPLTQSHTKEAAACGHLEMLEYICTRLRLRCTSEVADRAAANGHLHIVEYLQNKQHVFCTVIGANNAACWGHLEIIQHLRGKGIHCTEEGMINAASNGHLAVMENLHLIDKIPYTSRCVNELANYGHCLEFIQKLRTDGIHCTTTGANCAAWQGQLHIVQDLRTHGIHVSDDVQVIDCVAGDGHLDVLQDLYANGYHCTAQGAGNAARHGHLHVVQFLRTQGVNVEINCVQDVVENGHVHVLEDIVTTRGYLPEIDMDAIHFAAQNGHLKMIQYLRSMGVHGDHWTAAEAARSGHLDVLEDLYAHGIQSPPIGIVDAVQAGHLHILCYIHARSCCK